LLRTREEIITNWKELMNTIKFRGDLSSRPAQAKKFSRPHLNRKKLLMEVCACHPIYSRKLKTGGSKFRPS
jgi:hypothetical protein